MTDAFLERIRAEKRVKKLLALAAGNPNQNEAEAALTKAREIAKEHGINLQQVRPDTPLSREDKFAAMRNAFGTVGGTIKRAFPGIDDEDYSKYDRTTGYRTRDDEGKI